MASFGGGGRFVCRMRARCRRRRGCHVACCARALHTAASSGCTLPQDTCVHSQSCAVKSGAAGPSRPRLGPATGVARTRTRQRPRCRTRSAAREREHSGHQSQSSECEPRLLRSFRGPSCAVLTATVCCEKRGGCPPVLFSPLLAQGVRLRRPSPVSLTSHSRRQWGREKGRVPTTTKLLFGALV
eukprot:COSAG01_NODE_614_length_14830_cov_87.820572_16_plen_185_part_00